MKKLLQNVVANSGLSDDHLARAIKVSRPTVTRWRTGKSAAHDLMVPGVLKKIREMVRPLEIHIAHNLKISNRDPELILERPSWAVLYRGNCVDRDLEEEYEPMPSSRDDAFFERCRFTYEEALEVAKKWVGS